MKIMHCNTIAECRLTLDTRSWPLIFWQMVQRIPIDDRFFIFMSMWTPGVSLYMLISTDNGRLELLMKLCASILFINVILVIIISFSFIRIPTCWQLFHLVVFLLCCFTSVNTKKINRWTAARATLMRRKISLMQVLDKKPNSLQ